MRSIYILILGILVFFTSCFKEDEKVTPHDPGDLETVSIGMTQTYKYQVYFDFSSGTIISQNTKSDYDLGFACADTGWHIILNTASFMLAANTISTDFDALIDTTGMDWKYDKSDGNLDSTAIGNWRYPNADSSGFLYTNHVYVLNRGYDELGNELGLRKIVFIDMKSGIYSFRYANIDGTNENTFSVEKRPDMNFTYFSFKEGGKQLDLEPPISDWDLIFTQYTTLLYTDIGDPYPYLVTGALSNRTGIAVTRDTLNNFFELDRDDAIFFDYTNYLDEVGYDWKDIEGDVTSGNLTYVIVPNLSYIIRDHDGFYYKFRFISFYDLDGSGEKGYPTFEYQRL